MPAVHRTAPEASGCGFRRRPAHRVRSNTVQLGCHCGVAGLLLGLRPVDVVGAFDVPLGHLALDDAWRCAQASCGVEASDQPAQEGQPDVVGVLLQPRPQLRPVQSCSAVDPAVLDLGSSGTAVPRSPDDERGVGEKLEVAARSHPGRAQHPGDLGG